ncbi:MAG: hypothetical protein ACRD3N_17340 [Terracidiphilus sp.]
MFPTFGRGKRKGETVPHTSKNFLQVRIRPIARKLGIPDPLITFQVIRRPMGIDVQHHGMLTKNPSTESLGLDTLSGRAFRTESDSLPPDREGTEYIRTTPPRLEKVARFRDAVCATAADCAQTPTE